jgi:hypothetical protein
MRSPEYQKRRHIVEIKQVVEKVVDKLRKSMNKPIQDFKNKGVSVAVWNAKNGGYSFSIQKRYKDKQSGDWKESRYYYKEEMEGLIELLQEAIKYASNRSEHESQGSQNGPGQNVARELTQEELDDLPF